MTPELPPELSASAEGGRLRDLMLGIFLVQLAFFIVLVSLARPDFGRSKQVLANVADVFGPVAEDEGKPSRGPLPTAGEAGQQVLRTVGTFAGSLFGERAVVITGPGDALVLTVSLTRLFDDGEPTLRPPAERLFDSLVAGQGALPPGRGLLIEAAFAFDSPADPLTLARAGSIAKQMMARGLPAEAIAIADGAAPGTLRLTLSIANAERAAEAPPRPLVSTTTPAQPSPALRE